MSAWLYLIAAIILEVAATGCLKMSDGFEKPVWATASVVLYTACFWVLAPALKTIPVGVAYSVWAGVGIAAVAAIGTFVFDQKLSMLQFACIGLVLIGAVGLQLTTQSHA